MNIGITLPSQKRPYSKKNKQWRKDCTDAGESYALYKDTGLRKSNANKRTNYNLYSDILDQTDIEKTCNPLGVLGLNAPAKMQNYPICNPKIDVLVGESIKRKFDWKVKVVNEDAISQKEEELKEAFKDFLTGHIQGEQDEKQMQEDLRKFQKFRNFEYQDLRERNATHILKYLYHQQRLDKKFADGFKDALISAEEMYQTDIVVGEPVLRKLNPMNVYVVRSGESNLIEDADIIVITGYHSPGQIIDEYNDWLESDEIDMIETGFDKNPTSGLGIDIGRKPDLQLKTDESIDLAILKGGMNYGESIDTSGNIRVTKVYWRSLRKMLKVKSYDEFGDVQFDLQDENYKIDKSKGEESTELWVGEWWESHKIGGGLNGSMNNDKAIYTKMQPRPVQFRSMENPSKCNPGIVGTIYNTNDNQGVSLMDRMKPYQYLYNVLAYNAELSVAKNYGKIMRLNLADIPENWQIDQWLSFAQGMNIAVYDSFKEGNKGAAQGKLAGSMNQTSPVIDMEMGNTIQLYMNMMAFIKQQMGEISGVTDQRLGQIETREAVNNVERSLTQTSAITEYWFAEHEYVKIRALESLLETAKFAWKDKKSKKIQYITDDGSQAILEIEGEQFNECEYGLQITTSPVTQELLSVMKSSAQAALQAGIINFSQLLDIYSTDSLASIRRKLENAEEEKANREQEIENQKIDIQRESIAAQAQEQDKTRDFTREGWDREDAIAQATLENNLEIERLRQDNVESKSFKDGADSISIEKLRQDADKIKQDYLAKQSELNEKIRHNKATEELKEKDIKVKKTTKSATKK